MTLLRLLIIQLLRDLRILYINHKKKSIFKRKLNNRNFKFKIKILNYLVYLPINKFFLTIRLNNIKLLFVILLFIMMIKIRSIRKIS